VSGIRIDLNNIMAPALNGRGLDPSAVQDRLASRFVEAHRQVQEWVDAGRMGFVDLPDDSANAARVSVVADGFGQWFETIVVVGIGGSALGGMAIRDALLGSGWNERDEEGRDHFPRLYFLDNPDPMTAGRLFDRLDLRRTLFNIVSKSGSTAETMALYLVIEDRLRSAVGEEAVRGHLLFTTDPENGELARMAAEREIPRLEVPANVGGRFSVLSSVGLLPGAITGVAVNELLAGAARVRDLCRVDVLEENPAGMLAAALHALDVDEGCPIHVLMPYSDRLRSFAAWFQQLWGESLGKRRGQTPEGVEVGPTPLPALGATDQHSLLQLLMEGPRDKVVAFLAVKDHGRSVAIPDVFPGSPALGYLGGHTLEELLDVEQRATGEALRREGRPNLTVEVDRLDAETLGGLFMLFEYATAFAGALYGIDPFDQPGVELSKQLTYGLFGRPGYDRPEITPPDPRWIIGA